MAKEAVLQVRMDAEIKEKAEQLYRSLGTSFTEAVRIFAKRSLDENGMPFQLTAPRYNDETLSAIQEARDISSGKIKTKSYTSVKEMVAELESDDLED